MVPPRRARPTSETTCQQNSIRPPKPLSSASCAHQSSTLKPEVPPKSKRCDPGFPTALSHARLSLYPLSPYSGQLAPSSCTKPSRMLSPVVALSLTVCTGPSVRPHEPQSCRIQGGAQQPSLKMPTSVRASGHSLGLRAASSWNPSSMAPLLSRSWPPGPRPKRALQEAAQGPDRPHTDVPQHPSSCSVPVSSPLPASLPPWDTRS